MAKLYISYSLQPRTGMTNIDIVHFESVDGALKRFKELYATRNKTGLGLAIVESDDGHHSEREGNSEVHTVPNRVICHYKVLAPQSTNGPLSSGRH